MAKNGEKTATKAEFIDWWFSGDRIGTQGEWAAAHNVNPVTVSGWKTSAEFIAVRDAYRPLFRTDFVEATRVMLAKAKRGDVVAYQAVARVLGENAGEKLTVETVQRVAYVEPGALRETAIAAHPELLN